mmetsp:Transcript_23958/g.36716  ORF Transcript_23958/g.36716 Transcript_23958/m.36716 type:complete len:124 (-) Transcript_23958:1884-2255(-)
MPHEDLVHIQDSKIPAFLRIDKQVKQKREILQDFYVQYQNFDIDFLDKQVKRKLKSEIEAVSQDYTNHTDQVGDMLAQGEETNKNSLALQQETIKMRVQQNQSITDAMKDSKRDLKVFQQQCE